MFLIVPAIRGRVLGVDVYRGFAKLSDLADISKADIYDQTMNPTGTQRDLSRTHAQDAYDYVRTKEFGFWPEVFLCARLKKAITFRSISDETPEIGMLEFDLQQIKKCKSIAISRIDGNHRLFYADGASQKHTRIEKTASFCLAYDLLSNEEIQLFKDINKNQKPMNTSHLDGIEVRLTEEEQLKRRQPELYVAKKLSEDSQSPFIGRIYQGGKKSSNVDIPLRGIKTGIEYMLSRSTELSRLDDAEAKYRVIRNFFQAFKQWQPKSWADPKEYITLRGSGLWAMCFIGAHVIDRALQQDQYETDYMLTILQSGREWDWSKNGDFKGLGGRAGALEISKRVTSKLHDDKRMSSKELLDKILAE